MCVSGILALCSIGCNYFFPSVILPWLWSWLLMPHTRLPVPDHGLVFPPIKSTLCLTGVFYCFPHIDGAHFYLFAICMGSYLLLRILIYCFFFKWRLLISNSSIVYTFSMNSSGIALSSYHIQIKGRCIYIFCQFFCL